MWALFDRAKSVAIHNKNGKGLLHQWLVTGDWWLVAVAIHNKNGKGLLQNVAVEISNILTESQSTIKMEKGYYGRLRKNIAKIQVVVAIHNKNGKGLLRKRQEPHLPAWYVVVAIHNKNGKGLLRNVCPHHGGLPQMSQSTIKMEKGYYLKLWLCQQATL